MGQHIGFISTRFAGTDGVSLESAKWAKVLWDHKHRSFWFAGQLDRDPGVSMLAPQAWFGDSDIAYINRHVYGCVTRSPHVTRLINSLADHLKNQIDNFVKKFDIGILVVQNAVTIPMNIPLGVAITNFIAETGFPTIAHHHDFYWERDRFAVNAVGDFLSMAFPPDLPSIQHVTINSFAQEDLSHRCGVSSILVPNVLDFENEPPEPDGYARSLRSEIGLSDDDIMFLQPTRVVPRKGIEHSIALMAQLKDPRCKLIISHESGDEGHEYCDALKEMAERQGVDLRFIDDRIDEKRSINEHGQRIYTLADAYAVANFITYPSTYEGFGNALLEAFYYRKPILVNRYSIFIADIEPRGFRVVSMNGYLTRDTVAQVRRVIDDAKYRSEMVETNYSLSKAFFSYSVLRRKLRAAVTNFTGMDDL
ncbi:MAG: glycosyltransferase [Planctomycetota bacterium]|jgi:glycosyltransferase involved in cell wall biosynthesis